MLHFRPMLAFDPEARANSAVRTEDGTSLFYWSAGDGPRTLLFVHGWGGSGSGRFWAPLLQHLDLSGIRLIAADLRGHGRSDKIRAGFTTETFARDMFALLEHAATNRPIVVGYSMSAKWAQWMSSMAPERVAGQILISPAPALALPLTDDILIDWLKAARDRSYFNAWLRQFIRHPLAPEIVDAYFEDVSSTAEHTLRETFNMCRTGEFASALSATRAPTLGICGIYDPVLSPELMRKEVVDRIPGARMALLDCGHEIPLEKPLETAALIEAFVAALR
ncbi:MAG: alpha/beta hydrolase [Acidobacteriaceae bacterium]|nr:alpha/beta hydrolase [Acidobacteriaceae bacterium]